MKLTADFHTHTPYSHGKGTVLENAARAKQLGLLAVGITDHGFSHKCFALKRKEVPALIKDCRQAEEETGIKVLVGMESNIRGVSGLTDLTKKDYENFNLFLAGIHIVIRYEHFSDSKLGWGNWMRKKFDMKPSSSLIKETTQAYIHAIEKNPIDILTHLNYGCVADAAEVAKCCRDYGTYLELNSKKEHLTDEELSAVAATGVKFVIDSDAHEVGRVGDTRRVEEQLARVGLDLSRIENIDGRYPVFRFAEYKKHM